ncbi:MAG: helix-turn-helix transcriptional regulator, partial [Ruminococcus sp.]|nr:helix-turn-helix transcriptional regulator [Candidatus Copronaster equi]
NMNNKCDYCTEHSCNRRVAKTEVSQEELYDLAELFKVFGDKTRVSIISELMNGEMCVYHLSEKLNMGQSAISHQLRILRSAGLVRPRKDGRESYYSLDDEHIEEIYGAGLAHILHKGGRYNE